MKIIAFNGSPRKEWNTATLLNKALDGALSQGAEIELIHLYDLKYKGCISCFGCKEKNGISYGRCAVKDDLTPIFKKIEEADGIILGSPIYLGSVSGEMQSLLERLIFPYLTYAESPESLFPKKISAGYIFTMGIPEDFIKAAGYEQRFESMRHTLARIFGSGELLFSFDTYQFKDYSKVVATRFNAEHKLKRRQEVFPEDCNKAFEMGSRFAQITNKLNHEAKT